MYQRHTGVSEALPMSQLYEASGIFSPEIIATLREAVLSLQEPDRVRILKLYRFVVEGWLRKELLPVDEALAERYDRLGLPSFWAEHDALLDCPFCQVRPDEAAAGEINELYETRWQQIKEKLAQAGYKSVLGFWEYVTGEDTARIVSEAGRFLGETEKEYTDAMLKLQCAGKPVSSRSELEACLSGSAFAERFPRAELIPTMEDTLYRLGIDVTRQPNLVLEVNRKIELTAATMAFPVRVPEEIYAVAAYSGGVDAYEQLLRVVGMILPKVFISPKLPWAWRRLPEQAVGEAFAEVFAGLLGNGSWLVDLLNVDDHLADFLHLMRFRRLYRLRRAAARVIYTVDRSLGEDDYQSTFEQALGVSHDAADRILDMGWLRGAFDSWQGMRAGIKLEQQLIERFGPIWFKDVACGQQLKELWHSGLYNLSQVALP